MEGEDISEKVVEAKMKEEVERHMEKIKKRKQKET